MNLGYQILTVTVTVFHCDEIGSNVFSNAIFMHLDMLKSLRCGWFWPLNAWIIIIINDIGRWHKQISNTQKIHDLSKFQKKLNAFIGGVNLSISWTGSGNFLAFRYPMQWAMKIYIISRHGSETNKGSEVGKVEDLEVEASWGPQLASDMDKTWDGTGKCKNDSKVEQRRLVK